MFEEQLFKLNVGVDTYGPDIADGMSLQFKRLKNVQPESSRFKTPKGLSLLQTIEDVTTPIRSFAFYTVPTSLFTSLYALSNTSAFQFNFASSLFDVPAFYTGFPNTSDPFAKIPWLDAVYVTKRRGKLVKFQNNVATEIPDAPAGRYMIIADSHLLIANTTNGTVTHPVRAQWSDLYAPESFVIGPSSEADFFELSPDDGEITGLSYQRGVTLIYTRSRIWTMRYVKSSDETPGRYQFDTLFDDVGNIYHDAQIRVKEVDFFIGSDNIYKLDGFQLKEIGDPIWQFFQDTIANANFQDSVIAIREPSRYEISWIYNHIDGYRWSIVYNYKEDKWSDRDPQDVYCNINLAFPVQGYIPYEDVHTAYEDMATKTYDGAWQFLDTVIRFLYGSSAGKVLLPSNPVVYTKLDEAPISCEIESYEFDLNSIEDVKEINKLTLLFSKVSITDGEPDLAVQIGLRKNRAEDVVWSAAVPLVDMTPRYPDETAFYFRNKGAAKLIRFKLIWTNNANYSITELVKLSFSHLQDNVSNETPEK